MQIYIIIFVPIHAAKVQSKWKYPQNCALRFEVHISTSLWSIYWAWSAKYSWIFNRAAKYYRSLEQKSPLCVGTQQTCCLQEKIIALSLLICLEDRFAFERCVFVSSSRKTVCARPSIFLSKYQNLWLLRGYSQPLSRSASNLARTKFSRFTFLLLFRLLAPRVVIANDNRPEAFSGRKINRETHWAWHSGCCHTDGRVFSGHMLQREGKQWKTRPLAHLSGNFILPRA